MSFNFNGVKERVFVHEREGAGNPRYIVNFPTKRHWRDSSRIEDTEIASIAIPALGAGLGGLDWMDVRTRIENALRDLQEVQITVFEPL